MSFNYTATFSVTGNSALLPSTQSNYPLLVVLTEPEFRDVGHGGQIINAESTRPTDFVLFSNPNFTGQLKYNVLLWNNQTGDIIFIVKIPSLSLGMDFYAGIGDASITTFQGDPENVWDANFMDVTEFFNLVDETSNDFDGTNDGLTSVVGPIVQAWHSNGVDVNQDAYIPGSTNIVTGQALTFSIISKITAVSSLGVFGKWNTTDFDWMLYGNVDGNIHAYVVTENGSQSVATVIPYTDADWQHLQVTYDGANIRLYIDGELEGTTAQTGDLVNSTDSRVGWSDYLQSIVQHVEGSFAETRISNVARSADWIKIDYNSISDPSTFVTVSFQANLPGVTDENWMGTAINCTTHRGGK